MHGKEAWYKIKGRSTDKDTGELVYNATLVSDRSQFYGLPISGEISVYHKDVHRKE